MAVNNSLSVSRLVHCAKGQSSGIAVYPLPWFCYDGFINPDQDSNGETHMGKVLRRLRIHSVRNKNPITKYVGK